MTWEATTDEAILNTARELILIATEGNPPPLLDPFAGGGSIPLEAQRLGLEAHASDLNPVAVMINKAQIEIPPRFVDMPPVNPRDREAAAKNPDGTISEAWLAKWKGAAGLAADVRYYGERMREKAREKIGHLYPKHNGETVIAWIWARTVKCPNPACGAQIPLITSFELSKKKTNLAWMEPQIDRLSKSVKFAIRKGPGSPPVAPKIGRGARFRCLVCDQITTDEYMKAEGIAQRIGSKLIAIVTEGTKGRNFYEATKLQEDTAQTTLPDWYPTGQLAANPRHMTPPFYGMATVADLFTPRQLMALSTFTAIVSDLKDEIFQDALKTEFRNDNRHLVNMGMGAVAYAEAISVYLALSISKSADLASSLCHWQSNAEHLKIAPMFSRHALSISWDYAEGNPFSESSGNFGRQVELIANYLETVRDVGIGNAFQQNAISSAEFLGNGPAISTDPPYYDNVPYADLSDIFYVWLRRSLEAIYPSLFTTLLVPKLQELVADPVRHHNRDEARMFFEEGLYAVFRNLRMYGSRDYPITVYYAFKQADNDIDDPESAVSSSGGWEAMLAGLIAAGFAVTGTWPVRTERPGRLRDFNSNALASSIVLVCRPRPENAPTSNRRDFVAALRRELPTALKDMQSGNIAPVDLAQASIGPGMAIYSRYSKVLEADGSAMNVRAALGLINQILDEQLSEHEGDIDSDTRFAVVWFQQHGFSEGDFGSADNMSRAKNTSVEGAARAGIVSSGRGKVRLIHWRDYDPGSWDPQDDKRPTIWEAVHHLIERLNTHGETGSAALMTRMPHDMAAEARNLAYRLYSICERKGWADHARDYNALVISWAGIGEEAARIREAKAAGDATQQTRLFD